MADPHFIPSKINVNTDPINADNSSNIYITAVLFTSDITVDGQLIEDAGPLCFPSPLVCKSLTPSAIASVAYFIQ